jgi:hypothetical protein
MESYLLENKNNKRVSILIALFLFLFIGQAASAAGVILAQGQWSDGNGHNYVIVSLPQEDWESARADVAATLPAAYHLATITSEQENDFLVSLFSDNGISGQHWLGGFQDAPKPEVDPAEGWQWVTGEQWQYTNWAAIEPNDAGGIEDHLSLYSYGDWNDEGTFIVAVAGYVAESNSVVPIPAAVWLFGSALAGLGWMRRTTSASH